MGFNVLFILRNGFQMLIFCGKMQISDNKKEV